MNGNREVPQVPPENGKDGRIGKAPSRKPVMHACGKSDACIVPEKQPNKERDDRPAEVVEGRRATKGNTMLTATPRTQSRKGVSPGLHRVRKVAREEKDERFTALMHHVTPAALRESFYALKRRSAPGVDGVSEDGWFHIMRKTAKERLRAALARIKGEIRSRMHEPTAKVVAWLQVVRGYYQYHAISGNLRAMNTLRLEITRYWLKTLRRRGQKRRMNWQKFNPIVKKWIPTPRVYHPYPNVRFYANHPR